MTISSFLMKNDLFDETSVLINCVLKNKIFTIAMININVTEYAFVDESVAQSLCEVLKIESIQLIKKRLIKVYDERKNQIIIHVIYSKMIIQKHSENLIFMLIIKLRQQILILDKSWMRRHEINYHEKINIIEFFSEFCTHSKKIKTTTMNKKKNISFEKKFSLNQSNHSKFDVSIKNSRKQIKIVIKDLFRKEQKLTKSINKMQIFNAIKNFKLNFNEFEIFNSKDKKLFEINIAMIKASAFNMMSKRKNVNLFSIILRDVEKHLEKHNKSNIVIKDVLSFEYHEFLDVFDKKTFNTLISHRFYDHKIVLKRNVILDYISLYKMFEKELKIVKKYLEDNLEKKFIVASRSFFASSVMFMKKINESLRFCVDYRKFNQLIKKNKYSLSLIEKTLIHLSKTKYFIKLDIRQTFHRIRIIDVEFEDLITFRIKFDVYKYRVLSFELCNEFVTYQHYMNDVFFDYLDEFVSIYIDDILIYSNSKTEHIEHVKKILQRLRNAELQTNINKCEFFVHEIKYLELIIERDEIRMNSKKIEIILQWSTLENLKQIQRFLEFCNFYKRFIRNFVKIVKSLIKLIRKDVLFNWNEACKIAFELLKWTIIEASILTYFDLKKQIYIKNDSFDFVFAKFCLRWERMMNFISWHSSRRISFRSNATMKYTTRNCWRLYAVSNNEDSNCCLLNLTYRSKC